MSIPRSAPATQHSEEKTHSGYRYDAYGNTLDDGDSAFVYDDRNRLVEAQDPATQVTTGTYGHNSLGQRVAKTINGVTTLFTYDEAGHLIGEYDDTGAVIREYIWLGDRPVAMIDSNGNLHYIHVDHLNTPQVVTDDTQTVVWKGDYTPFGEVDVTVSTVEMNLRFPGQYYDVETGLNYNYFRSYDASTGRYTQSDPIGLKGGLNSYSYVSANPLMAMDIYGLEKVIVFNDNSHGAGLYPANVYVVDTDTDEMFGPFKGSTKYDDRMDTCSDGCPQISEGIYKYTQGQFPNRPRPGQSRRAALELGTVPTTAPNPNNGGSSSMNGAWIHNGYLSVTYSEGCLTIAPNDWPEFIGLFAPREEGLLVVTRR